MPTLLEIQTLADDLQVALDAEQAQVAALLAQKDAAIVALEETVVALEALVAEGGTAAERQALLDKLVATKADLEATVAP
jgi:hypothetical protein